MSPLERPQAALPLRPSGIHSREGGISMDGRPRGRGSQAGLAGPGEARPRLNEDEEVERTA